MKQSVIHNAPVVVGGLTPLTTLDYPDELAAVLFLQGCPWRCGYCQNSELLSRQGHSPIAWTEVIAFLKKRQHLLDAVVFSGGEPTLQRGLKTALQQVRELGFKTGLHTAGIYPDRLEEILPLIDWVGMDIKSAAKDYHQVTGIRGSGNRAWKSARLLIESGVVHEFRTTVHPDMLNAEQLQSLVTELLELGAENYILQECRFAHCLDESRQECQTGRLTPDLYQRLGQHFPRFSVRYH